MQMNIPHSSSSLRNSHVLWYIFSCNSFHHVFKIWNQLKIYEAFLLYFVLLLFLFVYKHRKEENQCSDITDCSCFLNYMSIIKYYSKNLWSNVKFPRNTSRTTVKGNKQRNDSLFMIARRYHCQKNSLITAISETFHT